MRSTLAVICCLMLVWTQVVLARASDCGVQKAPRACCRGCHQASCCAAKNAPESQSSPAVPVSSDSQNPISFLVTAALAWTLPDAGACELSAASSPLLLTVGAPLYERNCALLL